MNLCINQSFNNRTDNTVNMFESNNRRRNMMEEKKTPDSDFMTPGENNRRRILVEEKKFEPETAVKPLTQANKVFGDGGEVGVPRKRNIFDEKID